MRTRLSGGLLQNSKPAAEMACSNCNDTSPNGCVCQPGRRGDPGPANSISISVETLPDGSPPVVVPTGVSPNQHFNVGFPLSPLPQFSAVAQTGSPVEVVVGGTIDNPVLEFTIPSGDAGENGATPAGSIGFGFAMPAVGATTLVQSFPNPEAWARPGQWVYVVGAGAIGQPGGWLVIDSVSPLVLSLRNPGALDGFPLGIPENALPGTSVVGTGSVTQLCVSGKRGIDGVQAGGTSSIAHTVAGTLALDLSSFSYAISASANITLDWNNTDYAGQGDWVIAIKNTNASTISISYAPGKWEKDPAITLPSTIAVNEVFVIRFVKNTQSLRYTFISSFSPVVA